jgi:hypothetical protein
VSAARHCIYCREELQGRPPREHVIPKGLTAGFGGNNLTLGCVCGSCNTYFDHELDRVLTDQTFLGMARYLDGVKRDTRKAPIPSTDRTRLGLKGQPLEPSASPDGAGYTLTGAPAAPRELDVGAAVDLEVSELQDRTAKRCMAKIAFNYLAYVVGTKHRGHADLVLSATFDTARDFIRFPDAPEPRVLLADTRLNEIRSGVVSRTPPRGHLASLQSSPGRNDIVGHVQLLSWWHWAVTLAEDCPGDPSDLHVTHFWDLSSKTVRIIRNLRFRDMTGRTPG